MYLPHTPAHPSLTGLLKSHADQNASTSRFDSSKGRGPFKTEIGVGKVIRGTPHPLERKECLPVDTYKGWDEGVTEMSLGEKSILTISGYEHASQATEAIFYVLEETRCQMLTVFKNTVTMHMVHGEPTYPETGLPTQLLIPTDRNLNTL